MILLFLYNIDINIFQIYLIITVSFPQLWFYRWLNQLLKSFVL